MSKSEDYTRKKLEKFLPLLYKAAVDGVRSNLDNYPTTGFIHRKNTSRSITRDHIVDNLRAGLLSESSVFIKDRNQTTYFNFGGEYRILAKMGKVMGSVALNHNQTAFNFQNNKASPLFAEDDLPETTNLYLSYVPNRIDPRDPHVYLICPKKGGYHWRMELEPPAAAVAGEITGKPTLPPSDHSADLIRIPQAKPEATDKPDPNEQ